MVFEDVGEGDGGAELEGRPCAGDERGIGWPDVIRLWGWDGFGGGGLDCGR